jgi:hypothetical protein
LQHIPDELTGEIGAGEARVVAPSSGKVKVRRVEVAQDADGAILRRGWPEFATACGVAPGWPLVLRHHGGGMLTVKLPDASCCRRELGSPDLAGSVEWIRKEEIGKERNQRGTRRERNFCHRGPVLIS